MNQPFGLANMWLQGDAVTRTVALFLLAMSIISWIIILTKAWHLYKIKKIALEVECFWHAPSFDVALSQMTAELNPYLELASSAQEAMKHHSQQTGNRSELRQVVGKWTSEEDLTKKAQDLRKSLDLQALLLTRSEEGMSLFTEQGVSHVKAQAREVFDVSGAGDTVIATLAVALAAGWPLEKAMALANRAGGIVVGKLGTATVTSEELQ